MPKPNPKLEQLFSLPLEQIHASSKYLFWEGIFLVILGFLSIMMPLLFSFVFEKMLGFLLIVAGCAGLFRSAKAKIIPGTIFSVLSYLLFFFCGAAIIMNTFMALKAMTIIVGVFFLLSGCMKTAFALAIRTAKNWIWSLLDGIVSVILSLIIFSQYPQSAMWVIGLLVGIKLLFLGNAMIMVSNGLRQTAENQADQQE